MSSSSGKLKKIKKIKKSSSYHYQISAKYSRVPSDGTARDGRLGREGRGRAGWGWLRFGTRHLPRLLPGPGPVPGSVAAREQRLGSPGHPAATAWQSSADALVLPPGFQSAPVVVFFLLLYKQAQGRTGRLRPDPSAATLRLHELFPRRRRPKERAVSFLELSVPHLQSLTGSLPKLADIWLQ